jgi:hypothetical protein
VWREALADIGAPERVEDSNGNHISRRDVDEGGIMEISKDDSIIRTSITEKRGGAFWKEN